MTDVDRQLVQRITERVLRALANEPTRSDEPRPTGSGSTEAPAHVRPAIGVCTGDYRQFTDRPDLIAEAGHQQTVNGQPSEPRPAQSGGPESGLPEHSLPRSRGSSKPAPVDLFPQLGPVLTGFVTAAQVDAVPGGKLLLDAKAKLTPLAKDRVRERGMSVRRASPLAGRRGHANAGDASHQPDHAAHATAPWLWYADGHCPAVRTIVGESHDRLAPAASEQSVEPLVSIVMRVARSVAAGRASGALLFVRSAAAATCFANRCRSLRAAVATCPDAVSQAVDQIAANVLIVEYPYHDRQRMRAMVDRFINTTRPNLSDLDERLRELEQCA